MKILFLTKYSIKGPSSRYRTFQYIPYFEKHHIQCSVSPLFEDSYLENLWSNKKTDYMKVISQYFKRLFGLLRLRQYDYVFIEYELFPYMPAAFEQLLALCGIKYMLDYDDAIFHNYDLSQQTIVRKLLKNKIPTVMRNASAIIAGSPYLALFAQQYNSRVFEIPTSIDINKYNIEDTNMASPSFTIGWLGSKSTSKYVMDILPAIERFAGQYPCKFRLVGFDNSLLTGNGNYIEVLPWEASKENEYLNSFTVGIMPLRNTPWEKGKCGFKMIQYMACGKPVIVSPLPANVKIDRNKTALFAENIESWYDCFEEVYLNQEKYREIGIRNRKVIEEHYSIQANSGKYLNIFLNS